MSETILPTPAPRASILIVDDYPANLMALEAILVPLGHQVVRAQTGEEALKALLKQDFAAIVMDVQMPGMDGFQTAQLVKTRDRSRHIPILFLTAISKDATQVFKGYEHGAVDYLLKPFDPQILRAKLSVFVELWQRGERLKEGEAKLRELERAEMERASQARYRALLEAMPQGVLSLRADGAFSYCNRVLGSYAGFDPASPRPLADMAHPEERERLGAAWHEALRTGVQMTTELRLRRRGPDGTPGEPRWHKLRLLPQVEGERRAGWLATVTDIHDEKQARVDAEQASRAKDEFLATISHELRNPLNAILGWTRMLRAGKLDPARAERALETVERNAAMQASLIEDMLDVSRIITGKLLLNVRAVDLSPVVSAALDTVRMAAEAKQITVQLDLDDTPQLASGDPERLQQVVWNLLSNAIKFTPRGGRVEVRTRRVASQVELTVSDSGQGIRADFLPFVFDRFRQADSSSTRVHGGLGLGLAIVRHLVELHGGTVAVQSPGEAQGTTFTVRLPLRAVMGDVLAAAGSDATATPPSDPVIPFGDRCELGGLSVLVVDDEPDARELLSAVLEFHGARVRTAGNVEDALAALSEARPDVVVSDIGMPGADGYELARRLRRHEGPAATVPAAALTGFARVEDGQRALACGFDAHLSKPVDPVALVETVLRLARIRPAAAPLERAGEALA